MNITDNFNNVIKNIKTKNIEIEYQIFFILFFSLNTSISNYNRQLNSSINELLMLFLDFFFVDRNMKLIML